MSNIRPVKLPGLHRGLTDEFFEQLKPQPILDKEGHIVYFEGKPLMRRAPASVLKEVREFLKDNGIDEEPIEGGPVQSLAKQLKKFDDEPLELTQEDSNV
jgi:hypothetical protein